MLHAQIRPAQIDDLIMRPSRPSFCDLKLYKIVENESDIIVAVVMKVNMVRNKVVWDFGVGASRRLCSNKPLVNFGREQVRQTSSPARTKSVSMSVRGACPNR